MADCLPHEPTVRARWHRAKRDVSKWRSGASWYAGTVVLAGGLAAALFTTLAWTFLDSALSVAIAALLGAVSGPLLMWFGSMVYKYFHLEERFDLAPMVERPASPNAHGAFEAREPEPLGSPWWQIEYPDGSRSDWCQRPAHRDTSFQTRTHRITFDFPHHDQEGRFTIFFRGVIRRGDPPVPLGEFVCFRDAEKGWALDT